MVLSAADRFGDAEAVVDGPLRLTFTEVVERIRCAAGAFAELGIDKGERVAIWAPNSAEWMIAAFGLLTAGGVLVPVNTRFKAEEAADIIGRSGAKAVLVQKGFLGQDYAAPAGVPVIDLKSEFLCSGRPFTRNVSTAAASPPRRLHRQAVGPQHFGPVRWRTVAIGVDDIGPVTRCWVVRAGRHSQDAAKCASR